MKILVIILILDFLFLAWIVLRKRHYLKWNSKTRRWDKTNIRV